MKDSAIKRTVLIISCLSAFIVPFIGSSVNIALPAIGKEFKIDAVTLGWVPTSYLLASAMFLLPFGRIADIYGRKKIFLAGTIVYTIGSLFSAISPTESMLIASRVIQGIGSAMTFGTSMAILTSVFPIEERGWAIGINTASVYSGLSLGPFLGGFFTQHLGWRSLFYFNVPFGIIVIGLVIWQLKGEWAEAKGESVDLPGSIVYALTLILVMYGLSLLPKGSGIGLIGVGTAGVIWFLYYESRTASPILNVQIFRHNPVFTFSNLAAFIHYSSTFAVTFLMSLYLQYIKGLNAQSAGMVLISQPLMMAAFSPLAGRLSDRIEPRVIASIGMACTCAAIFLLSFISFSTGVPFIVLSLLFLGFGFSFFSSPNTNAVMSSVEKRDYGVASGTIGTMRLTGQMFSMGMAMMIFSVIIGKATITPGLYSLFLKSFKIALIINASLCFIGIFLSLARGKVQRKDLNT